MDDKTPANLNEETGYPEAAPAPDEAGEAQNRVYTRRPKASPQQLKRGKLLAVLSLVLGGISIVLVLVHFFISPLNLRLTGYNGAYFAVLPMLAACGGIVLSVIGRKTLPRGQDSFATMGLISSIIGFVFGTVQLVACTFVLINHFGF